MRYGMTLLCCAAAVVGCGSSSDKETFHANMNAAQEVPAPNVAGANPTGTAQFTNNGDGTVSYTVNASGLTTATTGVSFTGMHIHLAPAGVAAGITVPLTTPTPGTTAGTTSVTGTFTSTTCGGSTTTNCINTGNTLDSVLTAMRNGGAYLNIHTTRNTTGELRGQIQTGSQ
jgi:CHRD domain